jgi:hypothetical protein
MKETYIPTNHPGYYFDTESKVIVNTNYDELKEYKNKVAELKKMRQLESDVNTLKGDMKEIKSLLQALVNGKVNG